MKEAVASEMLPIEDKGIDKLTVDGYKVVFNRASKKHHATLIYSLGVPHVNWQAKCGWKFGFSDYLLYDVLPGGLLHGAICKHCLPSEYDAAMELSDMLDVDIESE